MTRKEQDDFITRIAPWAQFSQAKTGIPASIIIAQAILESSDKLGNWGCSVLAAKYNNFFGIKDTARFDEGYCELTTTEYEGLTPKKIVARFEAFKDPQRSFEAHARIVAGLPRYAKAMACTDDPAVFAQRLQEGSYSTNPKYAVLLMKLITQWNLTRFDLPRKKKEG